MKLSILLLTVALLQVHAKGVSQSVTLSGENIPVKKIFSVIKNQTGYSVFGNVSLLNRAIPVSVNVINMPLEDFMEMIMKDQPFNYQITEKTIILSEKIKPEKRNSIFEDQEAPPVTGIVRTPDGQPLGGVNIVVKGTKRGTTSKVDGQFSIEAKEGDVLIFTSIGYAQKEFKVGTTQQIGAISLALSDSKLDEVQIIAYGQTSTRLQVGNVTTVKAAEIEKQPVSNPLLALQGRVPGLQITQSTGLPGSGVSVLIQGQNSILNGNDPFYVVDGVPYPAQLLSNQGTMLGTSRTWGLSSSQFGNPLSFINPLDIESIEVLKDAAATSIYGSRAANGAILITTKKGKAGKTKVDLSLRNGWSRNVRRLPLMNTTQYLEMRREAMKNDGITDISPYDYDVNGLWDTTSNTDWQKKLTGKTAEYTDAQVSVSGGNNGTTFLVSGNYHRETNVFPGEFANQKGSFHYSVNNQSADRRFNLQLTGSYQIDDNRLPQVDLTPLSINMPPNAPANFYNEDGTINWALEPGGYASWDNPIASNMTRYKSQTNNIINNLTAKYELLPGWELKSSLSYNRLAVSDFTSRPGTAIQPYLVSLYGVNGFRSSTYGDNVISTWSVEPQTTYKRALGKGRLEILLGATIARTRADGRQVSGYDYISDDLLEDLASASLVTNSKTTNYQYKSSGLFGRMNYNWQDKYILEFTARRDGSSNFGPANRFHNFGAIAGAWIFSSESFVKDALPFISFGKLRASYGTTGNDQIGNYQFMDLYTIVSVSNNNRYQQSAGLTPTGHSNPYLQWEETRKLQGGIDIGFLNNRILLQVGAFQNRCSNQLLYYILPIFTGFGSISRNLPATQQNTGWEFSLSTENIKSIDFDWSTNFTLTAPRDKLIAFKNLENSPYRNTYEIGKSINTIKIYEFRGVDPVTGNYQVTGKDGRPTTTPDYFTDRIISINTNQSFYGGLQNSFRYKGVGLDFLFSFAKQRAAGRRFGPMPPGTALQNQTIDMLDRWQKPGDNAPIQRYSASYANFQEWGNATGTNEGWEDASYIRLNSLSLSWQFPQQWINKAHLRSLQVFMQGRNLLTITNYSGLDPETKGSVSLPPLQVITMGIQVGI